MTGRRTPWGRAGRVLVLLAFGIFFATPLLAMVDFSTRNPFGGGRSLEAWRNLVQNDQVFSGIVISFSLAAITVAGMLAVLVPTMIWVRLRTPWAQGAVEFLCLLPLTIPPLVIVVGLRDVYAWVTYFLGESSLTLGFVYVVLVLPYSYRALDAALDAIDLRTLSEAARSLGAGWGTTIVRVVVPNIWSGILSAAFVAIAVVMGEYTVASLMGFENLQVDIVLIGKASGPTSVAASLGVLLLGIALLLGLSLLSRRRRGGGEAQVVTPGPSTTTPSSTSSGPPSALPGAAA